MTNERTEKRLESMLAALRDPVSLDELTQARVQSRLEVAIEEAADAAALRALVGKRHGVLAAGLGIAAAAAAVLIVVVIAARSGRSGNGIRATPVQAVRTGGAVAAGSAAGGMVADGSAANDPSARGLAIAESPRGSSLAADSSAGNPAAGSSSRGAAGTPAIVPGLINVAADRSAEVTISGAVFTVYGPGWIVAKRDGAVVDAASITVDRRSGDAPLTVRYHGMTIVVVHAIFAASRTTETRVTAVQGEIVLRCPSGLRRIRSGASTTCEAADVAPFPRAPAPSLAPIPQPSPHQMAIDLYSVAELALRRGDLDAARRGLLAVIDAAPDSLDAATALLDLARLAASHGDASSALSYLDRLDRHPRHAVLAGPVAHLRRTLVGSPPSP